MKTLADNLFFFFKVAGSKKSPKSSVSQKKQDKDVGYERLLSTLWKPITNVTHRLEQISPISSHKKIHFFWRCAHLNYLGKENLQACHRIFRQRDICWVERTRVATPKVLWIFHVVVSCHFFAFLFPRVFAVSVYVPSWSSWLLATCSPLDAVV